GVAIPGGAGVAIIPEGVVVPFDEPRSIVSPVVRPVAVAAVVTTITGLVPVVPGRIVAIAVAHVFARLGHPVREALVVGGGDADASDTPIITAVRIVAAIAISASVAVVPAIRAVA